MSWVARTLRKRAEVSEWRVRGVLPYAFANEGQAECEGEKSIAKMWLMIRKFGLGEAPSDWNLLKSHVKSKRVVSSKYMSRIRRPWR